MGKQWKQWQTFLSWAPKSLQMMTAAMKLKDPCSLKGSYDKPRQHIKKQRHHLANKGPYSQSYGFCSSHVRMWELHHKEGWALKIDVFKLWCWRRHLRVRWTARKSTLNTHWKDWCWSWSSNTLASWCEKLTHWKRPWFWERLKAGGEDMTEDEMVGWHHQLNRHEFEQALGVGDGQGSLACYSAWGHK